MSSSTVVPVLCVDDDPEVLQLTTTYLERVDERIATTQARTGAEALDRLEDEPIECVVSDYEMPTMDGLDLLQHVREAHPDLPFILFTARGSEDIASTAISEGVTDYLQKETTPEQFRVLANRIANAVEHYRAERALRESEERYRTVVERSHDAILIYRGRRFVYVNTRVCELTGYTEEALLEMDLYDVIHPADRERVNDIAKRRADPDRDAPTTYRARIVTRDGDVRTLELSVQPLTYGGEYAALASARDVTDREEVEQRLRRQNRRLDEFASVISHDLRNPLQVATGALDLARTEGGAVHFDRLERSLDRMEAILEDLLTLARQGQAVGETEPVALAEVAAAAWETVDHCDHDATLEVRVGADWTVEADRGRLREAVENLLHNAVDHGGGGVHITVDALDDEGPGRGFVVADDGPGIPEDTRAEVFEHGFSTSDGGTGFGLSIVRDVVEAHGWEIRLAESERGGARFDVLTEG